MMPSDYRTTIDPNVEKVIETDNLESVQDRAESRLSGGKIFNRKKVKVQKSIKSKSLIKFTSSDMNSDQVAMQSVH